MSQSTVTLTMTESEYLEMKEKVRAFDNCIKKDSVLILSKTFMYDTEYFILTKDETIKKLVEENTKLVQENYDLSYKDLSYSERIERDKKKKWFNWF
jgi:hypothetical protein